MLQNFTKDTAIALLKQQRSVPFPVDFDEAWQWLEYSTKGHAKESFIKMGFIEGSDFLQSIRKSTGGRPSEDIKLTVDCFKPWLQ